MRIIYFLFFLLVFDLSLSAQTIDARFGKNRVQYERFEWQYVESDNFIIYFYQGGQDLAKYVLSEAESSLPFIRSKIDYEMDNKIEIVVYTQITELRQTNMGLKYQSNNSGGVANMVENKYFIAFNGDHEELKKDVRSGIAASIMQKMLFGHKIQEIVQNSIMLDLPVWFTEGVVQYLGEEWNTELDNTMRYWVNNGVIKNINALEGQDAKIAGQCFWNYLVEQYGEKSISNIIYLSRVNHSMDNAFLFVLGIDTEELLNNWYRYLNDTYLAGEGVLIPNYATNGNDTLLLAKVRTRKTDKNIANALLSPDGQKIVYTVIQNGKYKIILKDIAKNSKKKILKAGINLPEFPLDRNYPIISWNTKSEIVNIIYERRNKIFITNYHINNGVVLNEECTKFQQIHSACFAQNDETIVISAVRNGHTDLYTYYIPTAKVTTLTSDLYDDLDPLYINEDGLEAVLFVSNRTDDTLRMDYPDTLTYFGNKNLFLLTLQKPNNPLHQLSYTGYANEKNPERYSRGFFTYLSDESGVYNRYLGKIDSSYITTDTLVFYRDSISKNPGISLKNLELMAGVDSVALIPQWSYSAMTKPITDEFYNLQLASVSHNANRTAFYVKDKKIDKIIGLPKIELEKIKFTSPKETNYRKITKKVTKTVTINTNSSNPKSPSINATPIVLGNPLKQVNKTPNTQDTVSNPIEEKSLTEDYLNANVKKNNNVVDVSFTDSDSLELIKPVKPVENTRPDYYFQSEFDYYSIFNEDSLLVNVNNSKATSKPIELVNENGEFKWYSIRNSKVRVYHPNFTTNQVVTQLDKASSISNLDVFTISQGNFDSSLNGAMRIGFNDLFDDYQMIVGMRFPFDFNTSSYFGQVQFLKKRLDKSIFFSREAEGPFQFQSNDPTSFYNTQYFKIISHSGFVSLVYPLDGTRSIRSYNGFRHEKYQRKATDHNSLSLPETEAEKKLNTDTYWQNKLEYVHDDTRRIGENNLVGLRYKVFYEFYKIFEMSFMKPAFLQFKNTGHLHNIGFDIRHHQRVHKVLTWHNRFSGGKSMGPRKVGYTIGGMENWLVFDQTKRIDTLLAYQSDLSEYAFLFNANQMRGFRDFSRIGSNYAIYNSELRLPVFQYFSKKQLKKDFIQNFQVIGFFDMGVAWDGGNPFSLENRYITQSTVQTSPVEIQTKHFFNPILYGFGFGLRTTISGYFIKFDRAWGLESGLVKKPINYFSLGYDF